MNAMIKRMRDDESGFTLVEMLVVVAIMGVLASVAVVAIGGTAKESRSAACKSDVATVQTAADSYYAKNSKYAAGDDAVGIGLLKTDGFLRTDPSGKTVASNGYKINYSASTGAVSSTPADCAVS